MTQLEEKGKQLEAVRRELAASQSLQADTAKERDELAQRLEEMNELAAGWQSELEAANRRIAKLEEELRNETAQKNQYRSYYEKALERTIEKATFKELLVEIVKRLEPWKRK